jgi:hypothetical protein
MQFQIARGNNVEKEGSEKKNSEQLRAKKKQK